MLTIKELEEGKIYSTISNFGDPSLFQCGESGTARYKHFTCKNYFDSNSSFGGENLEKNIKLATREQIRHFHECEKANKYIPLSQIKSPSHSLIIM